jgi:hypothetical protein
MHRLLKTATARVVAALLALALSGAARALPARPLGPHRCECRAHGAAHVCACAICNLAAAAARRAATRDAEHAEAALPPCHRAAAAEARAAAEATERRRGDGPALRASCGIPEGGLAGPQAAEPYTLPRPPALGRVDRDACWSPTSGAGAERVRAPEPPRPRA